MTYLYRVGGYLSKKKSVLEDKQLFHNIRNLPTLPFIAVKVMDAVNNPRSSASDLAKIISSDEALAAKVLRLVNSAYYGFPNPITTITHAVAILGFNTLRTLVVGISISGLFSNRPGDLFDRKALWSHSVATAIGAKALARRVGYPNHEEMFLAGLLHDVGKIILDMYVHDEFIKAVELGKAKNIPLYMAEREVLGATHAEVGKLIGDQWKLPSVLTEAIRWHHEVERAGEHEKIAAIVCVANALALTQRIGASGDFAKPFYGSVAAEALNLEQIRLDDLRGELNRGILECRNFLDINELQSSPEPPDEKEKKS